MPPYLDRKQLLGAINGQALPALEALAANPDRLDRSLSRRFERDGPPEYQSSSESEEEAALYHEVLARPREVVLEESKEFLGQPFDKYEFDAVVQSLNRIGLYRPGRRYRQEALREDEILRNFCRGQPWNSPLRRLLDAGRGSQQRNVIVRHNIRKRWQRLGIWNPEWGIPGRVGKSKANDDSETWKWKWQTGTELPSTDPQQPIMRTMELRKDVAYGKRAPPSPRSCLREDSTRPEAESFIISRPWFLYSVEKQEFTTRESRIPPEQLGRPNSDDREGQVTKWWKARGDWEEDWETQVYPVPGWKWRHESPSPEPEDLEFLKSSDQDMDFTPSEVDALDAIDWEISASKGIALAEPRMVSRFGLGGGNTHPTGAAHGDPAPVEHLDGPGDQLLLEEEEAREGEEGPPSPPPRRRGRPRKTEQSNGPVPAPPTRRSARIKAIDNNPPPPPTTTVTQTTRKRVPRGAPAAPPSRTPNTGAPKKRGRPPKAQSGGIAKPSAPPKKRGRPPKLAKAAIVPSAPAASKDIPEATNGLQPHKRGRPRAVSAAPPPPPPKVASSTGEQQAKKRGRPKKVVQDGGITKATPAPPAKRGRKPKAPATATAAVNTTEAPRRGTRGRPSMGWGTQAFN